jgi:hypothetical protein
MEAAGDTLCLGIELVVLNEAFDLSRAVFAQAYIGPRARGPQQEIQAALGHAIAASKFGGNQLALADIAVNGLTVYLKIVCRLLGCEDFACFVCHSSIIDDCRQLVNTGDNTNFAFSRGNHLTLSHEQAARSHCYQTGEQYPDGQRHFRSSSHTKICKCVFHQIQNSTKTYLKNSVRQEIQDFAELWDEIDKVLNPFFVMSTYQ